MTPPRDPGHDPRLNSTAWLRQCIEQGWSTGRIAAETHCTHNTAAAAIRRAGLRPLAPAGRRLVVG